MRNGTVLVLSADGAVLGEVRRAATSIAASKVAGCPVQFSNRYGPYAWVAKS